MTVAHVRHDGFARQSLHRETSDRPCAWCGNERTSLVLSGASCYHCGKRNRHRVSCQWNIGGTYTYTIESDAGSCPHPDRRAFCDLACFDAYNSCEGP